MANQERDFQFSRRSLLRLPAAKGAGNLDAIAKAGEVAEFVAKNPEKAMAFAERFAQIAVNIFRRTFQPATNELFANRPESPKFSPIDRAANAVTDILQPHVETLRKLGFDPVTMIEPVAHHLVAVSSSGIFNGAILGVGTKSRLLHVFQLLDDRPRRGINAMNRDSYENPDTPTRKYAKDSSEIMSASSDLWGKGPFITNIIYKSNLAGLDKKQISEYIQGGTTDEELLYLGELAPIK